MTIDDLTTYLGDSNVRGFLRVIRAGESNQNDDAYSLINGGAHFTTFEKHPWDGIPTTQGARACGAYQFLGTTWKAIREQYGIPDFTPVSQDCGAVADIINHNALKAVMAGDLATATAKLAKEWISLPALLASGRAERVFTQYGGTVQGLEAPSQPAPEAVATAPAQASPDTHPQGSMPLLALLPLIAQFIPQIASLLKPNSKSAEKDAAVAQTVLNTVVQAAGIVTADGQPAQVSAATVGQAAEKMAADPALAKAVQAAVVTHPDIMPLLEVGGGVAAAREADLKQQQADKPFWKASAVFWISVLLLPLIYWLVGSLIVGGVQIDDSLPAWVKIILKLFGNAWNGESRSGGFNLVIGLALGGICGVFFGVSVTQQKQQQPNPSEHG
jgi:muramidase (phage lysozyme)